MRCATPVLFGVVLLLGTVLGGLALAQPDPSLPDPSPTPPSPPGPGEGPDPGQALPPVAVVPAVFFDEGFDQSPFHRWDRRQHPGDAQPGTLWHQAPLGREGSPAATLANQTEGGRLLPGELHQSLVSPIVDLTAVPALEPAEHDEGEQATRTGERAGASAQRAADDVVRVEPEAAPKAPARLVVDHRFSFPDDRFQDGSAKTGFTIEARAPGGEWVPLEPAPGWKTQRSAYSPLVGQTRGDATAGSPPDVPGLDRPLLETEGVQTEWNGCVTIGRVQTERYSEEALGGEVSVAVGVEETVVERQTNCAPTGGQLLQQTTQTEPATERTNTSSPAFTNAEVRPLEARGYTGTSDYDGDGEANVVRHAFDLSPWAGKEIEIRFRAGTSLLDQPGAFWAVDRAQVQAGSHVSNLRLELESPQEEHLAPPGRAFPLGVRVENVGQVPQQGPFNVNVSVDGPGGAWHETVSIDGTLGFGEAATGRVNFTPASSRDYDVNAELVSHHPDAEPGDDEAQAPLEVGLDRSVDIQIRRGDPVLSTDDLVNGTVVVENRGNVPVDGKLSLAAHPYDAFTGQPVGDGIAILSEPPEVNLPPSERRHPLGVDARAGVPFESVLPEGSYVLVARLGNGIGTAPLGVGASPPPVLVNGFEDAEPGDTSFEIDSGGGTWEVRAESDVRDGLVNEPDPSRPSAIQPGTADGRGAWVPTARDGLVLSPQDGNLARTDSRAGASSPLDPLLEEFKISSDRRHESYARSPRESVSVHVLSHEVDLRNTQTAELNFLSSLSVPADELGLTQLRVYVARDTQTEAHDQLPVGIILPDTPDTGGEECVPVDGSSSACVRLGSGITDPCTVGPRIRNSSDVAGAKVEGWAQAGACLASVPRWDALAPVVAGDLVHHEVQPHPFERVGVDLSEYAGSQVEIAFVLVSQAEDTSTRAKGTDDERTIGTESRAETRGAASLDQIHVLTDQGLRLAPSDVQPAGPVETVVDRVDESGTEPGWKSLGYAYLEGVGPEGHTLHGRAQVRLGPGTGKPAADGADPGSGLVLGTKEGDSEGIRFEGTDLHGDASNPHEQPVVTRVKSPAIDLGGLQQPVLTFDQRFDLGTELGGQPIVDQTGNPRANNDTFTDALQLPAESARLCDLPRDEPDDAAEDDPDKNQAAGSGNPLRFDDLRCLLDLSRERNDGFDVQSEAATSTVQEPPVSAGVFLRVYTKQGDGWSDPRTVAPVDGYRFPVGDAGGFQPTLDYLIAWDAPKTMKCGGIPTVPCDQVTTEQDSDAFEDPSDRLDLSRFKGTAVWAGNSDADGDGTPDWITSSVDLSRWAGRTVKLEFVLVSRTVGSQETGVQGEPWSVDGLVVREKTSVDRVSLDELRWPHDGLPLLQPGEPLPIRLDASTPSGLDAPVHARAVLQDAEGCVRGSVDAQVRHRDATGRVAPLPPGEEVSFGMELPSDAVQGPPPWRLRVAADVGRTPEIPVPARVDVTPEGNVPRDNQTGVYNLSRVDGQATFQVDVDAPSCAPNPTGWVVNAALDRPKAREATPLPHRDGEIVVEVNGTIEARAPGSNDATRIRGSFASAPVLVVAQGAGTQAGVATVPLDRSRGTAPIHVSVGADRVPPGSPVQVRVRPGEAVSQASVSLVPLDGGSRQDRSVGRLSPSATQTFTLEPSATGPHVVVVAGQTPDGDRAFGAAPLVSAPSSPARDPILPGRVATLQLDQGRVEDVRVGSLNVTPSSGISTQEREIRATVVNPGNVELEDVEVSIRAGEETIQSKTLASLLPGQHREVAAVYTPLDGSTVVEASVTASDRLSDRQRVKLEALRDLGTLQPAPDERSNGWRVDGSKAAFQDDSGSAPRDTVGTLPLEGQRVSPEGLADFTVVLNHDMDMERGFDGGQVLVEGPERSRTLDEGSDLSTTSPFSPVQGKMLSGRLTGDASLSPDTADRFRFDENLSLMRNATGDDLFEPLLDEGGERVPCHGPTHPGGRSASSGSEVRCQWVRPLVPVPESGFDAGIWYLHVGPVLADAEETWDVLVDEAREVRPRNVTQHLFLEAGEQFVDAAQREGALSVSFSEARLLGDARHMGNEATIEMCARFVEYLDEGPPFTDVRDERRCSSIRHDSDPLRQRPWGETTLRISNVPEGDFDLVRLEFGLRNGGLDGDPTVSGPFTGWFVGSVAAEAGGVEETWTPSRSAVETDPTTGRTAEADDWLGALENDEVGRLQEVVGQSGLVTVGANVDTVAVPMADLGLPSPTLPLAACSWETTASECTWYRALDGGPHPLDQEYTERQAALSTVPAELGLSCAVPTDQGDFQIQNTEDQNPYTAPTCASDDGMGLGPQVIRKATSPTHPVLERTRRLDAEVDGDAVTFKPWEPSDVDVDIGGKGYNLDYRLVLPLDLTEAAGRAVAELDLDKGGNEVVSIAARPVGSDAWTTIPVCPAGGGQCNEKGQIGEVDVARLDLTQFTGQRVELGIRAQHDADEGHVTVKRLQVYGGVLKLTDRQFAFRAWTDPSVEGRGWTVDEARLFGRTFDDNVGITAYESKLSVEDRVHVLPEREVDEDGTVEWTSPLRLELFNQGPEARHVELDGTVRKLGSLKKDCDVTFDPPRVTLAPRSTTQWRGTATFEVNDEDGSPCFGPGPGQTFGLAEVDEGENRLVDLRVNATPLDNADWTEATEEDNRIDVPLVADPFGKLHDEERHSDPNRGPELAPHERGISAELDVTPTRAETGELVTIEARLRAQTGATTGFSTTLELVDAGNGTVMDTLRGTDATTTRTRLAPYQEATVHWSHRVENAWENSTLLRLTTETLTSPAETVVRHAWLHATEVDPREPGTPLPLACASPDEGSAMRNECPVGRAGGESLARMAPPVVALRAHWSFPDPDLRGHTETGWALQFGECSPQGDQCPTRTTDPTESRTNWTTARVLEAPSSTLASIDPESCPIQPHPDDRDAWPCDYDDNDPCASNPCTTARETWANVAGGEDASEEHIEGVDVLAGTSPGAGSDAPAPVVLFSIAGCPECPDWTGEDREKKIAFRLVSFSDQQRRGEFLQIEDVTIAPVAVGLDAPDTLGSHAIPEAKTKAVPLEVTSHGAVGARVDPSVSADGSWDVDLEGIPSGTLLEDSRDARLLATSPISPTGTSVGTSANARIDVQGDPGRSPELFVPIQTQPGRHPDLVVDRVKVPGEVQVGDDVTVEVHVKNEGSASSPAVPVTSAVRYEDGTVQSLSPAEDSGEIPPLPPGGQAVALLKWTPDRHGDVLLRVGADLDTPGPLAGPIVVPWGEGSARELRECREESCRNVAELDVEVRPPPVADLSAEMTIHADEPLVKGEPVEVDLAVHNAGPATVPRFETRLVAGVVSLLQEDPLVVEEPLDPGETWSRTVTLIPPRAGDIRLTASAFSDERLVEEARGVRPDGTLKEADNVQTRVPRVIAHGIGLEIPGAVDGTAALESGNLSVPATIVNEGSEPVRASVAAVGDDVVGTLVGPSGQPQPFVRLEPNQARDGTLRLEFDSAPAAGRHDVRVEATAARGSATETIEVEVPRKVSVDVAPTQATVGEPSLNLSVPVRNTGNAEVTATVGVDAAGLEARPGSATLAPGEEEAVPVPTRVVGQPEDGDVWVRAGSARASAPLLVEVEPGPLPSITALEAVAGDGTHLEVTVTNGGTEPTFDAGLSVTRGNETLHETSVPLDPGERRSVEVPVDGRAGTVTVRYGDGSEVATREMTLSDLRPRVSVEGLRVSPLSPSAGERVDVHATLGNAGSAPAMVRPALVVDGAIRVAADGPVRVEPDAFETLNFTWRAEAGEHTLAVAADPLHPDLTASNGTVLGTSVNVTGGGFWINAQEQTREVAGTPGPGPLAVLGAAAVAVLLGRRRRRDT